MTCKATGHVHVTVFPGENFCQACGEWFEPTIHNPQLRYPPYLKKKKKEKRKRNNK